MKIFIDSADINEIRQANAMGLVDGVTTNPSLIAKTGRDFKSVVKDIVAEVKGPISLEVTNTTNAKEMFEEAQKLADIAKNVVIKIPLTEEGLKATKLCHDKGIHTNVTLCFSPNQALLAAKAGATYVSPFVGRLDDISEEGMVLIEQIAQIYKNYNYKTEIIVASVRNPVHVRDAALIGAHVCTIPYSVIQQLVKHPLTDIGIEKFAKDWAKVPK
jgi:transaldolase